MRKPGELSRVLSVRGWFILVSVLGVSCLGIAYLALQERPVVVTWSTASELDTAGFNLLRGSQRQGPFVRLNQELIPASSDPLLGGEYSYTDSSHGTGQISFYLLQRVNNRGDTTDLQVIEVRPDNGSARAALFGAAVGALGLLVLLWRLIWNKPRLTPPE